MAKNGIDILAIGVHPDDVELCCGGTLIKHQELGYSTGILDLTKGELGTRGNATTRLKEAEQAAKLLGVNFRENLGMKDGLFAYNEQNILKIIEVIRKHRPSIVLANAISDRHPDHGRAAKLTADACYYAGLIKIDTGQDAWRPLAIYHYVQDFHIEPHIVVDISSCLEKKMEAIMAFKTQFFNPDSPEPSTPISGIEFLEFLKARMRCFGRPAGVEFAEGFTSDRYLCTDNLFKLK